MPDPAVGPRGCPPHPRGPVCEHAIFHAAVWLTGDQLVVSYSDEPLAQYAVTSAPDGRHFAAVSEEQRFGTAFQSPRPLLWEPSPGKWQRVLALPVPLPRQRGRLPRGEQPALFVILHEPICIW